MGETLTDADRVRLMAERDRTIAAQEERIRRLEVALSYAIESGKQRAEQIGDAWIDTDTHPRHEPKACDRCDVTYALLAVPDEQPREEA